MHRPLGGRLPTSKLYLIPVIYDQPSLILLLRVLASSQRHDREKRTLSTPGRGFEFCSLSPSLSESIDSYSPMNLFESIILSSINRIEAFSFTDRDSASPLYAHPDASAFHPPFGLCLRRGLWSINQRTTTRIPKQNKKFLIELTDSLPF